MDKCSKCGVNLTKDEIGLYRKLFNRGAMEFMCISCSSEYLEVPQKILIEKIQSFKKMGCTLFE